MGHPQERTGSATWRRWLRTEGCPAAHPAALDLAGMKPAAAASVLAALPLCDAARVLEGLDAGPAGRILATMRPVELAGRAAAQMDVRIAARALKAMQQPDAASVLAAMDPAPAAARFPGISRPDLLLLMDTGAALARLRAMTPAGAGQRLDFLPLQAAASLLTRLDPDNAAQAMVQMRRWNPSRLLPLMPPETAAALRMLLRSDLAPADRHCPDTPQPGK
jgi:flagellar motility protein MotE (MotC chaperone)